MTTTEEQAIAHDLDVCDIGLALTTGRVRRGYAKHRKACHAAIAAMNAVDDLGGMTDEELLAALNA